LRHDINFSDCFFIVGNIYNTYTDKMDMALDYVGLAATMGLSAYVLASYSQVAVLTGNYTMA
jgi:hypothetical protein